MDGNELGQIKPIGKVVNGIHEPVETGWGSVVSEIRLIPEYSQGLLGLDQFSHAVVLFLMHQAPFTPAQHLVRRPRERADMPLVGIFGHRARHRPNPIGTTTVAIERLTHSSVFVRGLDAIDGTPVLDIKPHVRLFDAPPEVSEPDWIQRLLANYF